MSKSAAPSAHVMATVIEVLPVTGLAYLESDDRRTFAVTKSTTGAGLLKLQPGQRVDLTLVRVHESEMVSAYAPLN